MSTDTTTEMTPDEWFKANGYGQPTFSNIGGSGWAKQYVYKVADGHQFFVKTARQSAATMFKGEALGLMAMYHAGALRIPKVYHYGDDGRGGSYIIMEHLALGGSKDQTEFGRAMAKVRGMWERMSLDLVPAMMKSFPVLTLMLLGLALDCDEDEGWPQMHLAQPLAKEAQEGKFGFDCDNTIGGTSQPNPW